MVSRKMALEESCNSVTFLSAPAYFTTGKVVGSRLLQDQKINKKTERKTYFIKQMREKIRLRTELKKYPQGCASGKFVRLIITFLKQWSGLMFFRFNEFGYAQVIVAIVAHDLPALLF